jgi:hypothetical protein
VVRVTGSAARFEEFRERLRWLLVRDPDVDPYTEHHGADGLEYRFQIDKGLPFPSFHRRERGISRAARGGGWDHAGKKWRRR